MVSGHRIEQWMLKTAINAMLTEPEPNVWPEQYSAKLPPASLCRYAFGHALFDEPRGLYMKQSSVTLADAVGFQCNLLADGSLASVSIDIQRCQFLLSLDLHGWPWFEEETAIVYGPRPPHWIQYFYRPDGVGVTVDDKPQYAIRLLWTVV